MGRRSKILPEVKIRFIEYYLDWKISLNKIDKDLEVNPSSIRAWIRKYKTFGLEGLITKNTFYTSDIKLQAVNYFINGKGSL